MEDKTVAKGSASPKYYKILVEMFQKAGLEKKFEKVLKSGNIQFRWEESMYKVKERKQLLEIVKDCDVKFELKNGFQNSLVRSACIIPSKKDIRYKIIEKSRRWSCIDVSYNCGFGCTCIDSKLGTIFGLDCSSERIVMVPQHRVNPETFVDFYLYIREHLDKKAVLTTFDKWAAEKKYD